jgi:hypothetical protein
MDQCQDTVTASLQLGEATQRKNNSPGSPKRADAGLFPPLGTYFYLARVDFGRMASVLADAPASGSAGVVASAGQCTGEAAVALVISAKMARAIRVNSPK